MRAWRKRKNTFLDVESLQRIRRGWTRRFQSCPLVRLVGAKIVSVPRSEPPFSSPFPLVVPRLGTEFQDPQVSSGLDFSGSGNANSVGRVGRARAIAPLFRIPPVARLPEFFGASLFRPPMATVQFSRPALFNYPSFPLLFRTWQHLGKRRVKLCPTESYRCGRSFSFHAELKESRNEKGRTGKNENLSREIIRRLDTTNLYERGNILDTRRLLNGYRTNEHGQLLFQLILIETQRNKASIDRSVWNRLLETVNHSPLLVYFSSAKRKKKEEYFFSNSERQFANSTRIKRSLGPTCPSSRKRSGILED